MSFQKDLEKALETISEVSGISCAFTISDHGRVERFSPVSKQSQIQSWAAVLQPFLQKISGFGWTRSMVIRYRMGHLMVFSLSTSSLLVVITGPLSHPDAILHAIETEVISMRALYSEFGSHETLLGDQLQSLLDRASDHLKSEARSQEGFFGAFRSLAFVYFGKVGGEWVDQGVESLWLSIPITQRKEMQLVLGEVKKRMSHPIKRIAFEREAEKLIQRFSVE